VIDCPVPIVLASASEARRDLLGRIVREFQVVPSRVDESGVRADTPEQFAVAAAAAKACEVARRRPDALVIGADTVVICRGEVIGKPVDRRDALRILRKLTRRPHEVLTGLCLVAPDGRQVTACVRATVRMRRMTVRELEDLADTPGAMQHAGAYALQEDDPNVVSLEGSASAVMGLPLVELESILRDLCPL